MSSDVSEVLAGKTAKILCPLCLREFGERDIEHNLTEEHVIPDSAGGRITTLTCRPCNSECGSEIDNHFARLFRIEEARQAGKPIDARIKIAKSVGSPATVSFTENGLQCRLEPTTPYVGKVLMERFAQYAKGERDLNITFLERDRLLVVVRTYDLEIHTVARDSPARGKIRRCVRSTSLVKP